MIEWWVMSAHNEQAPTTLQRGLPARSIAYARTRTCIDVGVAVAIFVAIVFTIAPDMWRPVLFTVAGVLVLVALTIEIPFIDRMRISNTSYDIDEGFVQIRRGILFAEDIIVPTDRILNVAIVQGPILRLFGLARIRFVAISHFEALGPLFLDDAIRLRAEVQGHQDSGTEIMPNGRPANAEG